MRAKRSRAGFALLVTAAIAVAVTFASASPAFAEKSAATLTNEGLGLTAKTAGLGATATPLPVIVGNIIFAALSLLGIIFVLLMIYGGFIWMQARGNTDDVKKAKDIITNAIIGIAIIALAFAVTSFVVNRIAEAQRATPAAAP